jgi:FkbM family methyltransferase
METRVLRSVLRKGDIFLDIGAHIGWYSLNARQAVGQGGMVVAFEPNPSCVSVLKQNILLNSFQTIKIEKMAVSDINGKSNFWTGDDMAGSLLKQSAQEFTHYSVKKSAVKVITLDTYCREHKFKNIRLIKIDVEGAEEQVIKGSMKILKKYHPGLILEIYSNTQRSRRTRINMIRSLIKIGYKLYIFTSGGVKKVTIKELSEHVINVFMSIETV